MDYATKTKFNGYIDQENELLNQVIKEKRNLNPQEQTKLDALEVEIVSMEGGIVYNFEEVPATDINDSDTEKVNDLIAFCSNDLKLSGVNARFFREFYDDSCRKYSGYSFSDTKNPTGFVRTDASKTIWISPESICRYNENIESTENIETTVCHEMFHVYQLNSRKSTDEDAAWEYTRLAVAAWAAHYDTVDGFCDRHNIKKSCG
jgi:hypothetical protein